MKGVAENDDDFWEEGDIKSGKKKRKRQSDGKNDGKRTKSETKIMKSPNGSTIDDFFSTMSPKPAKKMRTLDELFASPKKDKQTKKVSQNTASTPKLKQSIVVDLTTPEPHPKSLLKPPKGKVSTSTEKDEDSVLISDKVGSKDSEEKKFSPESDKETLGQEDGERIGTCTSAISVKSPNERPRKHSKACKKSNRKEGGGIERRKKSDCTSQIKPTIGGSESPAKKQTNSGKKDRKQSRKETANPKVLPGREKNLNERKKRAAKNNDSNKNFLEDFAKKMKGSQNPTAIKKKSVLKVKILSKRRGKVKNTTKDEKSAANRISERSPMKHSRKKSGITEKKADHAEISAENSSKNISKRRKSSSDGVLFVSEVRQANRPATPLKTNQSASNHNSVADVDSQSGESLLWTEKYAPKSSKEIVGNFGSVDKLVVWLKEWRQRWEKELREISNLENAKDQNLNDGDDSDSDFELDPSDKKTLKQDDDAFAKAGVVIGPTGCGKTSAIFACARELGFKVFEMNASALRSSKQILSQLHEATQSHQVSKTNKNMNFFIVKENSKKPDGNSLILFKDADILFEEDKFFWSAIDTLITDTKRPILLTTSDSSILVNLDKKYEKFIYGPPSIDKQLVCLKSIAQKEGCDITEEDLSDVRMTNRLLRCDVRKTIHALQFWGDTHECVLTESSQASEATPKQGKKTKKRRRSSRRRSKAQDSDTNEVSSEPTVLKTRPTLHDVFSKTCGIFDTMSAIRSELGGSDMDVSSFGFTDLFSFIQKQDLNGENLIALAERVISTMITANLPNVITINWLDLLPVFEAPVSYSVGKKPLSIVVPCELRDPKSDMEFTYDFTSEEMTTNTLQEPSADFLMDEDSVDICYDSKNNPFPCVTSINSTNPSQTIRTVASNSAKKKLDMHVLDTISSMADACCVSDLLEYSFIRGQSSCRVQSLDGSRCKIKDGLLDFLPKENEMSHNDAALCCDIMAAIQVRSLGCCLAQLSDVTTGSIATPKELPLRFPHEGKTRRNHCYLRHSLQSKFLGGSFTTTRGFSLDYLPMIRSISRSESIREEAKKKRRFLHYFNSVRAFLKPAEMSRLVNDFKEVIDS